MENIQNEDLTPEQLQNFNQSSLQTVQPPAPQPQKKASKIKPWIINTIIIAVVLIIAILLPSDKAISFIETVVGLSALVVLFEGYRIEVQKYPGTFFGRGPWSYAIIVFILWLFAFPYFISRRAKILNGEIQMKDSFNILKQK